MDLRQFRYFIMVATEGSFSRAAKKLNMAQPPLSRQIQQLEDELGVRLLDRNRPITLTVPGRYFFEQVREVVARVDEIQSVTRRIATGPLARFSLGFVASALYDFLPALINRFRITMPNVEVVLSEMTTLEQMNALRERRIDVGFGRLRFQDEGITRQVIREEQVIIGIARDHRLLETQTPLKLWHTASEPLIIYPRTPRPSYADQVLSFYRDRGLEPKIAFEVRELQTALGLVAAGAGICLVPSSVRRLRHEDVAYLDLDEPDIVTPIIMSYRTGDTSPLLTHLRKLLGELDTPREPGVE